jgi:hypothetical protein
MACWARRRASIGLGQVALRIRKIRRSKGGLITKIHAFVDALGNPM